MYRRGGQQNRRGGQRMSTAIYLTPQEIEAIARVQLTGTAEAIRSRFIAGCVTGLRHSDYSRLQPGHIQGGKVKILTRKRNKPVIIPVHPLLSQMLPTIATTKPPTLRYFNMLLPLIGQKAGIRGTQTLEIKLSSGEIAKRKLEKYELITTHTARRSFATNAYKAGIPTAKIMLITGHSTEASFFKYIRIGAEENATELMEHEFFK